MEKQCLGVDDPGRATIRKPLGVTSAAAGLCYCRATVMLPATAAATGAATAAEATCGGKLVSSGAIAALLADVARGTHPITLSNRRGASLPDTDATIYTFPIVLPYEGGAAFPIQDATNYTFTTMLSFEQGM